MRKQSDIKNSDMSLIDNNYNINSGNNIKNNNFMMGNHNIQINLNNINSNNANSKQSNFVEDQMILNNRKHSQTNLINVNTNNNDPSYRLKLYKSQNKFNLISSSTSDSFVSRNDHNKSNINNNDSVLNHSINYQKILNNKKSDLSATPNEKSKFSLNIDDGQLDNTNTSNLNMESENLNLLSITIKLKEGLSQVLEVKKNDNITALVKNFCDTYNLGEILIKPITNKVLQCLEFMTGVPSLPLPNHFNQLLKEAFEFYSQPEKWESVFGEEFYCQRTRNDANQEKKRNKSA